MPFPGANLCLDSSSFTLKMWTLITQCCLSDAAGPYQSKMLASDLTSKTRLILRISWARCFRIRDVKHFVRPWDGAKRCWKTVLPLQSCLKAMQIYVPRWFGIPWCTRRSLCIIEFDQREAQQKQKRLIQIAQFLMLFSQCCGTTWMNFNRGPSTAQRRVGRSLSLRQHPLERLRWRRQLWCRRCWSIDRPSFVRPPRPLAIRSSWISSRNFRTNLAFSPEMSRLPQLHLFWWQPQKCCNLVDLGLCFQSDCWDMLRHEIDLNSRRKFRSQTSDNMDRWKAEQGRGREKRKIRRKKSRRERVRRKKMQMREKVGKSRNTVFFQWFGAPEGRKVGSLKWRVRSQLARWAMKNCMPLWREAHLQVKMYKAPQLRTAFGSWDVEKVHAVVARSTFPSQNVQSTPGSDHFWKLKCRKSARCCGAKHISKSKCTKHTSFGPLLEVEMSKKCTLLWREAHFEVKMYKTHQVRTTFGSWDVEKVHAVVARSTFRSQNVQNTTCSRHFWMFRCRKSARRCGAKDISK